MASSDSVNAEQRPLVNAAFLRVMAAQVAVGFGFSIYFLLPKYLATELGANASTIGAVAASGLLASVIVSPLIGAGLDRFGRRGPLAIGGFLVVLTSFGMLGVTRVGPALYGLRLAQGIGFALGFNAAAASVADIAPRGRLGQAMGLLGAASLLTNAVAPALGESIAHAWGWAPVFSIAIGTGVATMLVALSLPGERAPISVREQPSALAVPRLGYVTAVAGACFGTLITFTQPYALARGAERVSGYLIGYTLGALFVRVGLGGMADRFGHRRVAQLSLATYGMVAIGTSCLTPSWIVPFGVGFGLSHGFLYPALAALAAEGSNPERRGRALSAFNAYFNLGAGLALVGCGWLARVAGYPAVFVLVGALTTLSVVALKVPSAGPLTPPRSRAPTR